LIADSFREQKRKHKQKHKHKDKQKHKHKQKQKHKQKTKTISIHHRERQKRVSQQKSRLNSHTTLQFISLFVCLFVIIWRIILHSRQWKLQVRMANRNSWKVRVFKSNCILLHLKGFIGIYFLEKGIFFSTCFFRQQKCLLRKSFKRSYITFICTTKQNFTSNFTKIVFILNLPRFFLQKYTFQFSSRLHHHRHILPILLLKNCKKYIFFNFAF
jgi:hypothetical protein